MSRMRLLLSFLLLPACWLIAGPANARLIHVPGDYGQIHIAVEFAGSGDTVLIQPGRYNETIRLRSLDFTVGSLLLTSGNPAYIDSTIIDGDGLQTPVVRFDGHDAGSPLLRGITITGGLTDYGGGVICWDSTRPVIEDVKITGNYAEGGGGGLLAIRGANVRLTRVVFSENFGSFGGVAFISSSEVVFRNCQFISNTSDEAGGIELYASTGSFIDCYFDNNSHREIYSSFSNLSLSGVAISHRENSSEAVVVRGSRDSTSLSIDRLTINSSLDNAGTLLRVTGWPGSRSLVGLRLTNSIIWGDSQTPILFGDGNYPTRLEIAFCDIVSGRNGVVVGNAANLEWGAGNFTQNPGFRDPNNGDLRLGENSPCIDAGDPDGSRDADGTRADIGGISTGGWTAWAEGVVTDSRFDEPFPDCEVVISVDDCEVFRTDTDENGRWIGHVEIPSLLWQAGSLTARVENSRITPKMIYLAAGGVTAFASQLEPEAVRLTPSELDLSLLPGDSSLSRATLVSQSETSMNWSLEVDNHGDFPEWLRVTPPGGTLEPDQAQEFEIGVLTASESGLWSLEPGLYRADIVFDIQDYYDRATIPVSMRVEGESAANDRSATPLVFGLNEPYPQPFNSTISISYGLDRAGEMRLVIVDRTGREVMVLREGYFTAGRGIVTIEASGWTAGIYLVRLETEGSVAVRKVVLVK